MELQARRDRYATEGRPLLDGQVIQVHEIPVLGPCLPCADSRAEQQVDARMDAEREIGGERETAEVSAIHGELIRYEGEHITRRIRPGEAAADRERRMRRRKQETVAATGLCRERQHRHEGGEQAAEEPQTHWRHSRKEDTGIYHLPSRHVQLGIPSQSGPSATAARGPNPMRTRYRFTP